MGATFADWLVKEMQVRDITQADLARRSGVSTGGISDLLTGRREPGATMASKLAKGLDLSEEEVYRAAGLLTKRPEHSHEIDQIIHLVEGMTEEEQKEVLSYIRWKNNQKKK